MTGASWNLTVAEGTAAALPFAGTNADDQYAVIEFGGLYDGSGDEEQPYKYSFDAHGDIPDAYNS